MTNRHTQPFYSSRRTEPATRQTIDPSDKLNAVVMAYNVRQNGREYPLTEAGSLFDAVRAFNARRPGYKAF
jgi:hypothetical protein